MEQLKGKLRNFFSKTFTPGSKWRKAISSIRTFFRVHGIAGAGWEKSRGFEQPLHPAVTIVIPVHNQISVTLTCLTSIHAAGSKYPFEVIVVDDASTDTTSKRLKKIEGLKLITLDKNLGFLGACNSALPFSSGEIIVYLNNDTVVTENWLDELVLALEPEDVGLAGSKLIYPDGTLQEAGGIIFADGNAANYGRGQDPSDARFNYLREVDYCSGASIAVKKKLLDLLGGFDERYSPAYYEDTDMAMSIRKIGYKVIYAPKSVVFHFEGLSNGTDVSSGIKSKQLVNKEVFRAKWSEILANEHYLTNYSNLEYSARRLSGRKKTIVFIDDFPQWNHDSGSLRAFSIISSLLKRGFSIILIVSSNSTSVKYIEELASLGILILDQASQSTSTYISKIKEDIVAIWAARPKNVEYFLDELNESLNQVPLLFDTVDLHFLREQRELEVSGNKTNRSNLIIEQSKQRELRLMHASDVTVVVSPAEQDLLSKIDSEIDVCLLPNLHKPISDINENSFQNRTGLIFVGNFNHKPNLDGISWFLEKVYPFVNESIGDIEINVVGSPAPLALHELGIPNLKIHGWVEDLSSLYSSNKLAIAPLRYGAGVKGKVGEAWSHGLPVIMTPMAAEGMGIGLQQIVVKSSPKDFSDSICALFTNESLWSKESEQSLKRVNEIFGSEVFESQLDLILNNLFND